MSYTPIINVACAGGLGYIFGVATKNNAQMIAIGWIFSEMAAQLLPLAFHSKKFENSVRLVIGGFASNYLYEKHHISKTIHTIFSLVTFCIIPDFVSYLVNQTNLGSRKIT